MRDPVEGDSRGGERGFSLIEVQFAMVILAFSVLGVMGMFQWSDHGLRYGANGMRALAMAESRLEAKRNAPWESLLSDDLDADGLQELMMRDDGTQSDERAGDGMYTGAIEQGGIRLVWTVQINPPGSLRDAGSVVIQARARYPVGPGAWRELQVGTLRANPRYIGGR